MSFGLSAAGWKTKRLADVSEETKQDFIEKFGEGFDLDSRTPEGQIKNILDEGISKLWELGEALAKAHDPDFAEGAEFDAILAITGNTRNAARKSIITSGRARGDFGTVIPAGTILSVSGNADARFVTDADETISIAAVDEVQKLSFSADPTAGVFVLSFGGESTAPINWNDNAAAVQAALQALSTVGSGNVLVTGSISQATGLTLTFAGSLAGQNVEQVAVESSTLVAGGPAVTTTPSTLTPGDTAKSPLMLLTAEEVGPTTAPAGSLTVIETPVSGLDSFTNELDAEVGSLTETDAAAKQRRNEELAVAGAATINAIRSDLSEVEGVTAVVVFQNVYAVPDIDGRPPHSVDVVVEGGDEQDIADRLFDTVAGGIETIGDILRNVTDSQGFSQPIRFSRPDQIAIWVELDLTIDAAKYPSNGDDLVKAAIVAMGDQLQIGESVVVFGSDPSISGSIDEIPGITDFVVRIGTSASPTLDNNIPISARERADFDTSRITVSTS